MSDDELKKYQKQLKEFGDKVTKTASSKRRFLIELGVITPKGKLTKRFKGVLCAPNGPI